MAVVGALAEIPLPAGERQSSSESVSSDAIRVIEEAEALGIPWREILSREILAESTLQRFLGTEIGELPLWRVMSILPYTLLHCWRARDLVDRLSWEASAEGSTAARREIEDLLCCLTGRRARGVGESTDRARHSWFAYNRVLELQA